jgi:CRP-like cAMP-binding protein
MPNPLTKKLEQFTAFTDEEKQRLAYLISRRVERYGPHDIILPEGKKVTDVHLVLSGLAARSKSLPDGNRQIMAFLIPGDLCDLEVFVLRAMDHDIVSLSETRCALIPTQEIEKLLVEMSTLTKALWWSTMTDSAVLRERIIDHGRRDAGERIAHLFYEMLVRFRIIEESGPSSFNFPITQEELADATGLTPVHVNRTLRDLRDRGLLEWKDKVVTIPDPARLKKAARFDADYLHLDRSHGGPVSFRAGDLV